MTFLLLTVIAVLLFIIFLQSISRDIMKADLNFYKNEYELNKEQTIQEIESPYET
tara:strand:- start:192 stop:356 length:165 start_codon:yes stop_codon:yes gene_type:complete